MIVKPDKIDIDFDDQGDVLHISLGKPKEADDSFEPQDGVVLGSRKIELVGITIIGLSKKLQSSNKKK